MKRALCEIVLFAVLFCIWLAVLRWACPDWIAATHVMVSMTASLLTRLSLELGLNLLAAGIDF
jgi:hypothetical protein